MKCLVRSCNVCKDWEFNVLIKVILFPINFTNFTTYKFKITNNIFFYLLKLINDLEYGTENFGK